MLWVYDNAICDDLNDSLGTDTVRVIDPEGAVDIIAQIKNDNIKFPVVVVTRDTNYSIDTSRMNFTLAHFGVPASIDLETNKVYNERSLPINLNYNVTILTTNTADRDELLKELTFKYLHMFFLTVKLPYEAPRKIRFGISLDMSKDIEQSSGTVEYLKTGALYQAILPLKCEGCVLVSYVPHQLHHFGMPEIEMLGIKQSIPLAEETERSKNLYEVQEYRENH